MPARYHPGREVMRIAGLGWIIGLLLAVTPAFAQDEDGATGSVEQPPEDQVAKGASARPDTKRGTRTPLRRDPQALESLRGCRTNCLTQSPGDGKARMKCFGACTKSTRSWATYPAYTQC